MGQLISCIYCFPPNFSLPPPPPPNSQPTTSKIALIIGGTGGLGRATAELLAKKDCTVIVAGRNATKGAEVVTAIKDAGGAASFLPVDLANRQSIRDLHAQVKSQFARLDIAVNAAGMSGPIKLMKDVGEDELDELFAVNITGFYLSMQEQMRLMLASQEEDRKKQQEKKSNVADEVAAGADADAVTTTMTDPLVTDASASSNPNPPTPTKPPYHIITLASIYATSPLPYGSAYSASKHAVLGMTRSLALEGARHGIYVNSISPGMIPTGILDELQAQLGELRGDEHAWFRELDWIRYYPVGRFGVVADVARAVAWVVENDWMVGSDVRIDGGYGPFG